MNFCLFLGAPVDRALPCFIQVESEVHRGTTFRVYLPVSPNQTSAEIDASKTASHTRRIGRVLIADDEQSVRRSIQMTLERIGFEVVTVCDGAEAVEEFLMAPDSFDLVLLDVMMPELDGAQACLRIHEQNENVTVILMSGYSEEVVVSSALPICKAPFLRKPFQLEQLKALLGPLEIAE